jgi:catechol 2,3-dioxygenase-like lactoylglutathione lyase family enzyme
MIHHSVTVRTLGGVALALITLATGAVPRAADELLFDHISFSMPDPARAAEWYVKHLGATSEGAAGVAFGSIHFRFRPASAAGPSAGSVIDHLAFAFPSLDSKLAEWQAAGITPVTPPQSSGGFRAALFDDPWGIRLEVVQDGQRTGLHHVHLLATDPAATMKWLTDSFGGTRVSGSGLEMLRFGPLWIAVQQVSREPGASAGHVIDHLGWTTTSVDETAAALKRNGVKFTTEPRTTGNLRMAFVEGPNQLRVEVLQR